MIALRFYGNGMDVFAMLARGTRSLEASSNYCYTGSHKHSRIGGEQNSIFARVHTDLRLSFRLLIFPYTGHDGWLGRFQPPGIL